MACRLHLKRGKEKPLVHHHPWIFSGAISRVEDAQDGDSVDVYSSEGEWLARAAFNSRSQITARVWTFRAGEEVDAEFFVKRVKNALERRTRAVTEDATGYRLVNAESDQLPGLIVDRYAEFLIVQFLTLGAELHKKEIVKSLVDLCSPLGIYERSDVDIRLREGLALETGVLYGEEPPDRVEIVENSLRFYVDVKAGQKTGFYFDQRENRRRAAPYLRGQVLNAFAYTGAFGVYAAAPAVSGTDDTYVLNLDTSADSLALARANFEENRIAHRADYVIGDAFQKLREFESQGRRFDAVVLDPPKFATSRSNIERALRGYKDINLLALRLLGPKGRLVTFSCSGLVSADLFQKVVFGASVDAKKDAQILVRLAQAPDHPVGLSFPEGEYLKGLVLQV